MELLFHTIAIEPARWTPQRVHRPLAELLPHIAAAGFRALEIYEPHLALAPDESGLPALLAEHELLPVMLSSYLDISPAADPDASFAVQLEALLARVRLFGFRKVRLFPGRGPASPAQLAATIDAVASRLRALSDGAPGVDFLLETHDGGLADDPAAMVSLVEICARQNIALLFQPTVFEPAATRAQFAIQKPVIRHFHLQNRNPDLTFARLANGVIPWPEFLAQLPIDASLEFVPSGICQPAQFDLDAALREAVEESRYAARLLASQ